MKDKALQEVREAIIRGYRLGVCDSDGNNDFVTDAHGNRVMVKRARKMGTSAVRKIYPGKKDQYG